MNFSPIELEIFKHRFNSIAEEMGVVLCRSSFSPNIKERKDFSCAIFDGRGNIVAQAAHIPVHLGSMALSVQAAIRAFRLAPGDVVLANDPYLGGTHLPDLTMVAPYFSKNSKRPTFYVANRAHHSDIGGKSPGSMPLASHLEEEGVVIPPTLFFRKGKIQQKFLRHLLSKVRKPQEREADLLAQFSANRVGTERLHETVLRYGLFKTKQAMRAYQGYEEAITKKALKLIPCGRYQFRDYLEDDGFGQNQIPIEVSIEVGPQGLRIDFSRCSSQVRGPVNATRAITVSAVAYVFRCLILSLTGEDCLSLKHIHIKTKKGSIVDARYPAPVAGGNVETSQRIVDVLLGALAQACPTLIPAASQGTMNNLAFGNENFTYYETLAGGTGAGPGWAGTSAIHSHMTNTLNTPIEAIESEIPVRVTAYKIRRASGGRGKFRGGDGLIRAFQFLEKTHFSLLSERRRLRPYGLKGGEEGFSGINWLKIPGIPGLKLKLPGKLEWTAQSGSEIVIETPGGGGYGKARR